MFLKDTESIFSENKDIISFYLPKDKFVKPYQKFITKTKGSAVARPNRYQVMIFPPAGLGIAPRDLAMMAESVSFPGQNHRAGTDLLRHGPQREVVHGTTYGPFGITFICTEGMPEKKFFEDWQEFIVNKETWEPKFYSQYIGSIVLEETHPLLEYRSLSVGGI